MRTPFGTIFAVDAGRAKRTVASHKHKAIDKRSLKSCKQLRNQNVPNGVFGVDDVVKLFRITFGERSQIVPNGVSSTPPHGVAAARRSSNEMQM